MSNSKSYDNKLMQLQNKKVQDLDNINNQYNAKLCDIDAWALNEEKRICDTKIAGGANSVNTIEKIILIILAVFVIASFFGGFGSGFAALIFAGIAIGIAGVITDSVRSGLRKKNSQLNPSEKSILESQKQAKQNQLRNWLSNEKSRIDMAFINSKKQLDQEYQKRMTTAKNLAARYLAGHAVKQISLEFAKAVNTAIKYEDSRPHIKTISTNFDFSVEKAKISFTFKHEIEGAYGRKEIGYFPETYDLLVNSINPLKSEVECDGLAEAIMQNLNSIFYGKFTTGKVVSSRNDSDVKMTFTIVNKNYKAPINV